MMIATCIFAFAKPSVGCEDAIMCIVYEIVARKERTYPRLICILPKSARRRSGTSFLIQHGMVGASACADAGFVQEDGIDTCGLEKTRDAVNVWQNQFHELIISTSEDTGVSARLLKNLFARESQFWPGLSQTTDDMGLGQLTENGADTTYLWNFIFLQPVLSDHAFRRKMQHGLFASEGR